MTPRALVPPLRTDALVPQRLVDHLNRWSGQKLTLVSAPAGYGKTTLLSRWALAHPGPVAWVSLIRDLPGALALLERVADALERCGCIAEPRARRLLQSASPTPREVLSALVEDLATAREGTALVLDDYHAVRDAETHEAVALLIEHAPSPVRLILATRDVSPLPLARLRVEGALLELRTPELRLTPDEVATLCTEVLKLGLDRPAAEHLGERAEGWVAGVQIAAVGARSADDPAAFIAELDGTHPYVADYLMDEVFQQQPEEIREFLMNTSILAELCAPLCEAVCGGAHGRRGFDLARRKELFLFPVSGRAGWLRYHPWFADALRHWTAGVGTHCAAQLHARASAWYESAGMALPAARHALRAGDFAGAARIVEVHRSRLLRTEIAAIAAVIDAIPPEVRDARPLLCSLEAQTLVAAARFAEAERRIQHVEALLARGVPMDGPSTLSTQEDRAAQLKGDTQMLRGRIALGQGDIAGAAEWARQALKSCPPQPSETRASAFHLLGTALEAGGDFVGALQAYEEVVDMGSRIHDAFYTALGMSLGVRSTLAQGRHRAAIRMARRALELAGDAEDVRVPRVITDAWLAVALYEHDDLAGAEEHALRALSGAQQWHGPSVLLESHIALITLAAAYRAQGRWDESQRVLQQAREVTRPGEPARALVFVVQALLALREGKSEDAREWAEAQPAYSADAGDPVIDSVRWDMLALYLIQTGREEEAVRLASRRLQDVRAAGLRRMEASSLALLAMATERMGDSEQAQAHLRAALSVAEPERWIRTFVDLGYPLGSLLRRALNSRARSPQAVEWASADYLRELLEAFARHYPELSVGAPESGEVEIAGPLTERELQVLRLLSTGMTNEEIGKKLFVTTGTVKQHVHKITVRLGARNRTQAAERAREMGLL